MSPEDLFGVSIRVAGIVFVTFGLGDLIKLVLRLSGFELMRAYTWHDDILGAGFWLVIGFTLFTGANFVVAFAYPRRK